MPDDYQKTLKKYSRAAKSYDNANYLQREISDRVINRLQFVKVQPQWVLDLGCGTGNSVKSLKDTYKEANVIGLDVAFSMVEQAKNKQDLQQAKKYICADAYLLPIASNSLDLVFSNFVLHWCDDLSLVFQELFRVLKPGGLLIFATVGPDSLKELKQSWKAIDNHSHVRDFLDMHDVGDKLMQARFYDPVIDMELVTLEYDNILSLLRDVQSWGSHNVTPEQKKGFTTPGQIKRLEKAYQQFQTNEHLPVTFEIIYGLAWKPDNNTSAKVDAAEVVVPFPSVK